LSFSVFSEASMARAFPAMNTEVNAVAMRVLRTKRVMYGTPGKRWGTAAGHPTTRISVKRAAYCGCGLLRWQSHKVTWRPLPQRHADTENVNRDSGSRNPQE